MSCDNLHCQNPTNIAVIGAGSTSIQEPIYLKKSIFLLASLRFHILHIYHCETRSDGSKRLSSIPIFGLKVKQNQFMFTEGKGFERNDITCCHASIIALISGFSFSTNYNGVIVPDAEKCGRESQVSYISLLISIL